MGSKSALTAMVTAILLVATAVKADDWLTYQNDRYGTTIDYPAVFKMQPPPDADDGRTFKSADGAKFTVSASYFATGLTAAEYHDFVVENLGPGATITYQKRGKNWFVVSGTKNESIFYEKHLLSHGAQMNEDLVISYPAALKATFDPIVARMAKSFRSGAGFQTQ